MKKTITINAEVCEVCGKIVDPQFGGKGFRIENKIYCEDCRPEEVQCGGINDGCRGTFLESNTYYNRWDGNNYCYVCAKDIWENLTMEAEDVKAWLDMYEADHPKERK